MEWSAAGLGVRRAGRALGNVLFPPTCALCRSATAEPHALCPNCWAKLRFIEAPLCPVLGTPFASDPGPGAVSPEAMANPPRFRRMRAALAYDDASGRLVSALKYGDRIDLAPMMATWMARAGRELLADADFVVPVPLHRFRLFTRRFNQSAELARTLAREAGAAYAPLHLVRRRWTSRQVGLGRESRRENVRGAFHVPDARRADVEGRRVLLVDDVYTTGATVEAATAALLKGGAASVDVLVFARVAASH